MVQGVVHAKKDPHTILTLTALSNSAVIVKVQDVRPETACRSSMVQGVVHAKKDPHTILTLTALSNSA
ncbi:hypothetical protein H257_18605 [Aphanomyces astaci]|uniref:Uncharacterized protein n=1 Tax=Aphanomyces astaci TaxID=112090 RepID=W4FAM5_APHAT|nr:hypothetical protein H257_18605 [Aphanomyces astaci]ETV64512.1 hypothetical protein H257_18605 [Aphanomyces astaci]|eukprot:XP_009846002.1 hypothetical protein H257_18605 [Aphanomyces astaci]